MCVCGGVGADISREGYFFGRVQVEGGGHIKFSTQRWDQKFVTETRRRHIVTPQANEPQRLLNYWSDRQHICFGMDHLWSQSSELMVLWRPGTSVS